MADLTFYTNPRSRGAGVRSMPEEVGAPYATVLMEFGEPMQADWFRDLNPMAKVPVLRHGSQVVTETAAICVCLADAFPDARLAPAPDSRSAHFRWLMFFAGPLEAAVTDRALGLEVPAERRGMVGSGDCERTVAALEGAVSTTPFLAGEVFTAADADVGSQVGCGLRFGTLPDRPALRDFWSRLEARPAQRRAAELDMLAQKEMP
ncbi:MAG: glutathione S-transferase family protein [Gemmobacter sp.]